MPSVNKIILIGNVGRDCELRYLANGTAQAQFSLACNHSTPPSEKRGEWKNESTWFNIVAWRDLAERISPNVLKGEQVYVEGRMTCRKWEADGQKHERWEVMADKVFILGRKEESERSAGGWSGGTKRQAKPNDGWGDDDDSLPFE